MNLKTLVAILCCATPLSVSSGVATAAEWKPDKAVEIIVPNAPGGGNDRIARLVQKVMQENRWVESPLNVVNKPGAGIVIGMNYLNQRPPDGHSISIISATFLGDYVSGRSQFGLNDVTPIAQLFTEYVAFAVRPESKIQSGKDLIALLKTDAASVSTGIAGGVGNHNYIALALVARGAGGDPKKLKVVSFNGGSEAITAAMGGHVDMVVSPAATLLPHAQSGKMRILAISSPSRLDGPYAAIPAWKELGANAVSSNWRTMVGARNMTPQHVAYWESALARVAKSDEWNAMLQKSLLTNDFLRSAETRKELRADYEELKTVMGDLGLAK